MNETMSNVSNYGVINEENRYRSMYRLDHRDA